MNNEEIRQKVETILPERRYQHTLRVVETAKKLAEKYGGNQEQVETAALLHDVAKFYEKERMEAILLNEPTISKDYLNYHISLWHAPVGAVVARDDFKINDTDILNAISYHTTGRVGMSLLEKLVFLADYIEPGRSFPGVDVVRQLSETNLDQAIALTLKNTVHYLVSRSSQVYPDTIHAYNEFIPKLGG